jgi:O-antigen ligase
MYLNDIWSLASIYNIYYKHTQQSMGSINRFSAAAGLFTLSAWYSATQSRLIPAKAAQTLLACLGYSVVLGTGSRMAIIAVPIAIFVPWLWMRINNRLSTKQLIFASIAALGLTGSLAWLFVIKKSFATSDVMRLRMASCWIHKGMLKPTERFWIGTGFDSAKLREACEYIRPGNPFGHAHNTFANVAGHHGLLGLIVLLSLLILVTYGLWRHQQASTQILSWSPFNSTSWAEISLGLNLTLLIFAVSTTIYVFSPINQVLIGLAAGSALALQNQHPSQ